MYLLRKFCICNYITMIFFKVIVIVIVVSLIRNKYAIVIISIIHFLSIMPSSVYIYIQCALDIPAPSGMSNCAGISI